MRFCFDDQQLEFSSQMRSFAERHCSPAQVREAWGSELGWSQARWDALAEIGVLGLTVPESFGGLGLGMTDAVLVLEEAGRACMPEPLLETMLGSHVLGRARGARGDGLRSDWLGRVADGRAVLAVGTSPTGAVAAAEGAHLLLLEHRAGDEREIHAVDAADVDMSALRSLDGSHRLAAVVWEPSPETLVCEGPEADDVLADVSERAATGASAMLLGVADKLIALAAGYSLERTQFGKPIGSFQAVKHQLVNALVRLEFARPVVYRAAWSIDTCDADSQIHASMAKAQASEAASVAARVALQVHGAIGYTWEHDLHLWMKRAWSLSAAWGDASSHRARVLEVLVKRNIYG